ncbi:hypothetical protein yc1106_05268 [Curvularia clavata]|uniref:NAD(P)-binding domain-containing protein n=1 Tax=Curvularia clavata TaxID=95742 RepID=A0A9Q9DTP6_CURCL|nr:hypothetical protein yc1106_05268 [Curvularia clavata]
MSGNSILVFGATGPAGICLLRELLYRKHQTIAFVRSPSKIPQDLVSNSFLELVKGDITDKTALSKAVASSKAIISLLGPNTRTVPNSNIYANFYEIVLGLMRAHGVSRILAMGTISSYTPDDRFSVMRGMVVNMLRVVANSSYRSTLAIGDKFQAVGGEIEWTVFRIFTVVGESDEAAWKASRDAKVFAGYVGHPGSGTSIKRGTLARWLVDGVEQGMGEWVRALPLVTEYKE